MEKKVRTEPNKLVVAAIDFGTTYSGYAYKFYHTLQKDPLMVLANFWEDEHCKLTTSKAPTTVLFNPQGEFDSFGFQAEARYAELADEDKHHGWRYFKHFKMKLHGRKNLRREMQIEDDQRQRMPAVDVFSAAIKFMKDALFKAIQKQVANMEENDIYWVLTVPAIWQYNAKQFMKEAALKAGISINQFTFALEPEAAAVYCKQYEISKCGDGESASIKTFSPGSKFMVIDMGGGTVDITVYEVQSDKSLKEIHSPSGGPWGGMLVDKKIHGFFEKIFGPEVWNKFKIEEKTDYLELLVTLESKKRKNHTAQGKESTIIVLPRSLLKIFKKENDGKDIGSHLATSEFVDMVKMTRDKLRINTEAFVGLFETPKQLVLEHLQRLLDLPALKGVSTLMMVGGFSESSVMQKAICDAFPEKRTIIPAEAETIVMRGAVLFGFNKEQIHSRKMPFSYGISTAVHFNPRIHPPKRSFRSTTGEEKIDDVFHLFIKKGQDVSTTTSGIQHSFNSSESGDTTIEIYQTPADDLPNPSFVYEAHFERIGALEICPNGKGRKEINVTMKFDDIELVVEGIEKDTKNKVEAKFNFLR